MKLTTQQLLTILEDISQCIKEEDSYEGSIQYTCITEGLKRDEWEVKGAYRIGNFAGQGGMRILE